MPLKTMFYNFFPCFDHEWAQINMNFLRGDSEGRNLCCESRSLKDAKLIAPRQSAAGNKKYFNGVKIMIIAAAPRFSMKSFVSLCLRGHIKMAAFCFSESLRKNPCLFVVFKVLQMGLAHLKSLKTNKTGGPTQLGPLSMLTVARNGYIVMQYVEIRKI